MVSRDGRSNRAERTREALRSAALSRFLDDGFDNTAVADIAADAGVTERTFYRHFTSKDEVLFADYEARLDWFRRALEVRPRREPITTSVLNAIESFPDDPELLAEIARLRERELDRARIEPHILRVRAKFAATIEDHLAAGNDRDLQLKARVIAQSISAAVFSALDMWMQSPGDFAELDRMVSMALAVLNDGIASGPSASR